MDSQNYLNRKTILVVDDTRENLSVITGLLGNRYRVLVANSGAKAIKIVHADLMPDLILLDVMMPEMDGYAVLQLLRKNPRTQHIPVIFVTAMDSDEDEEHGLTLGAVDYITKPVRPAILEARVKTHLELKEARDRLRDQNGYLEQEIHRRTFELDIVKDISLTALATLAEKRDNETGNHLYRTQAYIQILMQHLVQTPPFKVLLTREHQILIANAAPLHDIGKVGIPDTILLKPGKLTIDEFEVMKQHSQIGFDAITSAIDKVLTQKCVSIVSTKADSALAFLEIAKQIAISHHEKWDGSGYPLGLSGEEIPLPGRLMAIADVFDALSCKRHYKEAFPREKILLIIGEGRGAHFDPDLVDAFFELEDQFFAIATQYADH